MSERISVFLTCPRCGGIYSAKMASDKCPACHEEDNRPLSHADIPTIAQAAAEAAVAKLKAGGMIRPQEPPEVTEAMRIAGKEAYIETDDLLSEKLAQAFYAMWRAMQAGQAKEGE